MNGKGVYYHSNGHIFDGDWINGKKQDYETKIKPLILFSTRIKE